MKEQMVVTSCQHDYTLDGSGHGFCKFCNREVQFDPLGNKEMQVIKEGTTSASCNPPVIKRPKRKITKELEKELLVIGPHEFVNKYKYSYRAVSYFTQLYRKLGGEQPVKDASLLSAPPPEQGHNSKAIGTHMGKHMGKHMNEHMSKHIDCANSLKNTRQMIFTIPYGLKLSKVIIEFGS